GCVVPFPMEAVLGDRHGGQFLVRELLANRRSRGATRALNWAVRRHRATSGFLLYITRYATPRRRWRVDVRSR
ncbi:MAG: hypothetical protein LC808_45045, partial [Actinobacteria bacterium]|nr:hypothetical protein [Actinomycetota bacterium]